MNQEAKPNEEAFEALYRAYNMPLYYFAYALTRDHYMAQDVVQETFLKALHHLDAIREDEKKRAWLFAISRNTAMDVFRKKKRHLEIAHENMASLAGASDNVERQVRKNVVMDMLLTLKTPHWQALLLVYEYGWTYEQLARHQNKSVSAVKSNLHRAKNRLRTLSLEMGESY